MKSSSQGVLSPCATGTPRPIGPRNCFAQPLDFHRSPKARRAPRRAVPLRYLCSVTAWPATACHLSGGRRRAGAGECTSGDPVPAAPSAPLLARDSASERRAAMPDKSTRGSSVGAQPTTGRAGADRALQLGESDRGPGVDAGSHGARPATALGVATTRARDHEPDAICRLLHGRRHVDRRRERRRPRAPCPWRLRGSGTAPCRRDGPAARRYGVLAGAGPCCFGCPLERVRLRLAPRVSRPFQSAVPIGRADTPASDGSLAWRAERRPVERRAGAPRRSVRSGALAQRMWVSTLC
jgi:hypothetical protein